MRGTNDTIFARKYSHAKMPLQPYLEQHGQHLSLLNLYAYTRLFWYFFVIFFLHRAVMYRYRAG